ncbi:MAG: endonuclease/exonuclease/phosphatase family protein [Candidatus Micrarchaeia archaeon]
MERPPLHINLRFIFLIIILLLLLAISFQNIADKAKTNLDTDLIVGENSSIRIAAWNLQVFGDSKAENQTLLHKYAAKISSYDLIFIQEIRDEDGSAFARLCEKLEGFLCFTSSRAGRTNIKEEYGVIYNKSKIIINNIWDFNPDIQNRWERPPLALNITAKNQLEEDNWVIVYVLHAKPSDAPNEIRNLQQLIGNVSYPVIVMGDLNADCSFYNVSQKDFRDWIWVIKDDEDTTVGKSDCAYDRIIINTAVFERFLNYGIEKDITLDMSDHYLIWIAIN